jgi:L-alanine-DL-glutamate epimerase-like enolase superfamily enzyme
LRPRALRALLFRCPIDTPVVTSFGVMRERPMLLVRVEDQDGVVGWGEIWCNFPAVGAEHRARLVASVLAPLVEAQVFDTPTRAFEQLSARTAVLAIQSGEPGPLAQAIAGIDIALWDLAARRAGQPLWRMLGGRSPRVRVYASGINPDSPDQLALARHREGYRAFKLKVGFGASRDLANLRVLRGTLGESVELMVDANQAWSLDEACETAAQLASFDLKWLEEPLRADRPWSEWRALAAAVPLPLAAGENLAGSDTFDAAIASRALQVVQPDIGKWGGFSACLPVARRVLAARLRYCPHWLGGGIGLLASAHLLAAVGGDGMLEVDANDNPLRTLTCGPLRAVQDGAATLTEEPGLCATPDEQALREFAKLY